MTSYWNADVLTGRAFTRDGWLLTGDLGYLADGELFIVGRMKDVVKRGGKQYDAVALADALGSVEGLRPGRVSIVSVADEHSGSERIVVVAEVAGRQPPDLVARIRTALMRASSLSPDEVVLIRAGELPRSTSGKILRDETVQRYLCGAFATPTAPVASKELAT